jgi:Zn-dependent protease with chaperone function
MDGSATSAGAVAEGTGKPAGTDVAWRREVMFRALTFAFLAVVLVVFWSAVTLAVLFFSRGLW